MIRVQVRVMVVLLHYQMLEDHVVARVWARDMVCVQAPASVGI